MCLPLLRPRLRLLEQSRSSWNLPRSSAERDFPLVAESSSLLDRRVVWIVRTQIGNSFFEIETSFELLVIRLITGHLYQEWSSYLNFIYHASTLADKQVYYTYILSQNHVAKLSWIRECYGPSVR